MKKDEFNAPKAVQPPKERYESAVAALQRHGDFSRSLRVLHED